MSILLAVCSLLLWERKHVSNLCMAEGSANTKVVLYCWAHHCQVLTSQGITQGITEPPNFQLFATNTAKAIYSRTNYFLSFFLISIYMCLYWFLDLGVLQLCAHFLGSLAFKEFARENNVLLKTPSFIWCGNFLCRNILLKNYSRPRLFSHNMTLILEDYLGT